MVPILKEGHLRDPKYQGGEYQNGENRGPKNVQRNIPGKRGRPQ